MRLSYLCLHSVLALYWKTEGCDIKKLFRKTTQSVNLDMTVSSFSTMMRIFTNVSQCFDIGCTDKQSKEKELLWDHGAGYNCGDLCALLPDKFTMEIQHDIRFVVILFL